MSVRIPSVPESTGDPAADVRNLRTYLVRLADVLDYALNHVAAENLAADLRQTLASLPQNQ